MSLDWCHVCCTRHDDESECPGPLEATGPEAIRWRTEVGTGDTLEEYGVLLAPCRDVWRARILTLPRALWVIPGGYATMKFVGPTATAAERQAVRFIREHCRHHGLESDDPVNHKSLRQIRFHTVRFGTTGPGQEGGSGDLSDTGMFVITTQPAEMGSRVHLSLALPNQTLALVGTVRWCRMKYAQGRAPGMGLQLESPPDEYLRYLKSLD